jgi:mRNA interferase MazF
MRRGEIWTLAGGPDYAGKPRPAVIVQDDRFAETASVTVCALTSFDAEAPIFRIALNPTEGNGLRARCFLMVDKITTVPRNRVGRCVGHLASGDLARLNTAMLVFLGLAGPPPREAPTTT